MTRAEREKPPPPPAPSAGPPPEGARPVEWDSVTHRFSIDGHKGYLIVAHEDARPVHLEIRMAKEGGVLRGLLHSLAVSVSLGLESGVPLSAYVDALAYARFEPSGWTRGELGYAHSIADYVFRWLRLRYPDADTLDPELARPPPTAAEGETCSVCGTPATFEPGDACPECGHVGREHASAPAAGNAVPAP